MRVHTVLDMKLKYKQPPKLKSKFSSVMTPSLAIWHGAPSRLALLMFKKKSRLILIAPCSGQTAVEFTQLSAANQFRLPIREYEYISADYTVNPDRSINPALHLALRFNNRKILGFFRTILESILYKSHVLFAKPSVFRLTRLHVRSIS